MMNSSTVNSLFGNDGKPKFNVRKEDKQALQENLGKEHMANKDFMFCVKHFKGAALLDTLSMNACVVSCMRDRLTTREGSSFANFVDKRGTNRCMLALVQEKGWTSKCPKHTRKQNPEKRKID